MNQDLVDSLLSKNSVEMKVGRSQWGKDKIVVFRRKLENLLLGIAINSYNASRYVISKHVRIKLFFITQSRVKSDWCCL